MVLLWAKLPVRKRSERKENPVTAGPSRNLSIRFVILQIILQENGYAIAKAAMPEVQMSRWSADVISIEPHVCKSGACCD